MKILHIISAGYPCGGAENILIKLKDNFENKGHEIKILSSVLRPELNHFSDFEFKSINSNNPMKIIFNLFNPYSFRINPDFSVKLTSHQFLLDTYSLFYLVNIFY